jgi:hypothetical protein
MPASGVEALRGSPYGGQPLRAEPKLEAGAGTDYPAATRRRTCAKVGPTSTAVVASNAVSYPELLPLTPQLTLSVVRFPHPVVGFPHRACSNICDSFSAAAAARMSAGMDWLRRSPTISPRPLRSPGTSGTPGTSEAPISQFTSTCKTTAKLFRRGREGITPRVRKYRIMSGWPVAFIDAARSLNSNAVKRSSMRLSKRLCSSVMRYSTA